MVRISCGRRVPLLVAIALTGCGASNGPGAPTGGVNPPDTSGSIASKYDMANRCFAVKADGSYLVADGSGFAASGSDAASAERFYMKPAGLARYVFYTADQMIMTGSAGVVSATAAAADGSDWTLTGANNAFTATALNLSLSKTEAGQLKLGGAPVTLAFEPATGCTEYPEMPTGIDAPTFKANALGTPVIGFAEVHAHMGMGSEMSDGSKHVGPSAGGVMWGQAIHRFGVPHALADCAAYHGPDGTLSAENIILDQDPTQTHDTQGWPTFVDWPKGDSMLHQQMYYKWVERAYKAGLRTMVIHGTNIEALCNVAKAAGGDRDADLTDVDCTDMGVGTKQVRYLYDMEQYIDAQEGGPGKGWFRIVKNPAEARAVIADGKMAVIPGLEFSNIFHCNVTFVAGGVGGEVAGCTKEDIDREIDEVWDLGVRAVFPYHDVDSALGGTGIFDGAALNLVGFYGTNGFWKTYDCENGGEGPDFFYNAGAYMYSGGIPPFFGSDPITATLIEATGGLLPLYPTGKRQCNARDVTDLGKYAIDKILKKGFTLDIDHAEIRSKQYMLDQGARFTPNYPMISAHGGHGGISNAQVVQIVRQGGIVYPAIENGKTMVEYMNRLKPLWQQSGTSRAFAMGYGADSNGLRNLPGPRGAGTTPIQYPFTLFSGPGWGPQFSAAGIAPLQVDMLSIPGGQSWNMDEVGMAHYGLAADIVEEIRIEGGQEAIDAYYRSAETYLQLWEQTLAASVEARKVPSP